MGPGGVLRETLGRGVRSTSHNTYPIYDRNIRLCYPIYGLAKNSIHYLQPFVAGTGAGKINYEGIWLKRAYEECLANKHVKALNEGMSAILTSALSHRLRGASFVQSLHE